MNKVLVVIIFVVLAGCSLPTQPSRSVPSVDIHSMPTLGIEKNVAKVLAVSDDIDEVVLANAFTRCVAADQALWLRSKPWESSPTVIPNALLRGTPVQIFYSPHGYDGFVEVWVPSEGVTGYVNIKYVGECK